jgi:hypothetical protein
MTEMLLLNVKKHSKTIQNLLVGKKLKDKLITGFFPQKGRTGYSIQKLRE